jgi:hypothetical protein
MKAAARTTEEIAAEWRTKAFSDAYWKPDLNQAGGPVGAPRMGESGGRFGGSDSLPRRRVYLKPGKRDPNPRHARAAREKIASDLAYDLGITVPPVVLARYRHATDEENICASLVMYPAAYSWSEIVKKLDGSRPSPREEAVRKLIEQASALLPTAAAHALAFDTWVQQQDHGPHNDHNIVFGYEPKDGGRYAFILLDFALAFGVGGRWETTGHSESSENCKPAPLHPKMIERVDPNELSRMIDKIEKMPDTAIDEIVRRIPSTHLPAAEMDVIVGGLMVRRELLRAALGAYLTKEDTQ